MATKKKNIRLQPRDIEIFDWLYKFRFLTADQIAGLVEAVEQKVSLSEYEFREGYYGIIRRIKLLKNARSSLKPDGILAIGEWLGATSPEQVKAQMIAAGYELLRIETFLEKNDLYIYIFKPT